MTHFAVVMNKHSAESEILHILVRIQEFVCETNDGGPHQKHPDKIRRPFFGWCRIDFYEQPRKVRLRDKKVATGFVLADLVFWLNGITSHDNLDWPWSSVSVETTLNRNQRREVSTHL
jgi:hypothetical protein